MRRPSYRRAVEWIADNDEPTCMDPVVMSDLISVVLVGYLFDKDPDDVADAVVRTRVEENQE